jgi:hypothetical protein
MRYHGLLLGLPGVLDALLKTTNNRRKSMKNQETLPNETQQKRPSDNPK